MIASRTYFCPHHLAYGAGELKASTIKADLEPPIQAPNLRLCMMAKGLGESL